MSVRVGDVVISGGGADVDNRTINNNEDNELQAIAVVDEGSASYTKTWSGTLAEYEALGDVHDPDTLYYILDDSVGGNVYTKDEVDALLLEKQDTLVSGTNIKTINNQSILGSGNINIQGGTATIDNLSITNNTDGEIQTIGTINQNDNTEALKEWKGTLAEYNAIEEKDDSTKYYIMDDQVTGGTAGNRNVGDIFYSMRTEEILSGAVKCNGATYEIAEFTGEESVGSLLLAGKLPYVSLSEYATEISTNGVCGKFGWDGEGSATFKVPTLNDVFLEASNSVNGGFVEAGLPNITGEIHWNKGTENPTSSGVFNLSYTSISDSGHTALTVPNATTTFDFDASRSSTIYGNSTTVQPKSVKYSAYVQLVLGATDEALETCHNVMSDVDST